MLYKKWHIPMIRSRSKTATRREWATPQVCVGGVYMATTELFTSHEEADCYIQVVDLYEQRLGEMTDEDAQKEGDYETVAEFADAYEEVYGEDSWNPLKKVWVVEFVYVGEEYPDMERIVEGCPNCGFSSDRETRIEQNRALLLGEAENPDDLVCEYHQSDWDDHLTEAFEEMYGEGSWKSMVEGSGV